MAPEWRHALSIESAPALDKPQLHAYPIEVSVHTHVLERSQWVPAGIHETFAFFADAANLESITPPWLHFRILTPLPIAMREGALIEYQLKLHGLPVHWRTRISRWEQGVAFVDEQLKGPYAKWVHLHTFVAERDGTRLGDRVEYALPLDPLSRPVHPLYVRPLIERIFDHRRVVIRERFGADPNE